MSGRNEEELKRIRVSLDEAKRTVFQLERRVRMLEEQQRLYKEQAKVKSGRPQVEETEISVSETTETEPCGSSELRKVETKTTCIELPMETTAEEQNQCSDSQQSEKESESGTLPLQISEERVQAEWTQTEGQETEDSVVDATATEQPTPTSLESEMIEQKERVIETVTGMPAAAQTEKTSIQQPKKIQKPQAAPRRSAPQFLQSIPRKERKESQSSGGRIRLLQEEPEKAKKQQEKKAERMHHAAMSVSSEKAETSKKNGRTFQFTQKMILPSIFAGMILLGVVWLLSVLNSYGLITPLLKIGFFYLVSVGLFFIARKKMPQMIFRQLLYGLAFAVAILTTGAGVLLYHLIPLLLGFVLSMAILLVGFWVSREEKSEILTIVMLVTSLLLPHLMIVENLSIIVVILYSMITVGFVSWFDKENQFQVSEVLKNIFTLFIILHIGQVSVLLLLLTLLLGLLLLSSNVFVALRNNVRGRWLFVINSGIAAFALIVTLFQINAESHQWLWSALIVWIVCLGLSYYLRADATFQDLYFFGSSLFVLMAAFTVPTSFWSTWNIVFAVVIAVGYFSVASFYHMKWTTAVMTVFFVFIEFLSLFGEWKDQIVIGIGLAGIFVWIYSCREKVKFLDWILPTFVISAHLWFSLALCIQRPDNIWMILILLLSAAALQQWWRPMTKLYANYLLGYQAVLMYAALPIYLNGLFISRFMLWVVALVICAYLLFVAYKQLRLPTYASLGAYLWIFVCQFSKLTLLEGLVYLLIGLLTMVAVSYKKTRFVLLDEIYVNVLIVWDILLLIWVGFASQNGICAIVIGLSLSGLAILAYQDWKQNEDWLLQNYLMAITALGMFLFVLFLSVDANAGMRFIAMLLYVLFFAGFTYLERAYYCVRKPVGVQQIRLPNTNLLIAWLFVLWRTVTTVSHMMGSSDFVRDISISIVLFLYGLILLWYGNYSKQNRFERYSLMIILFSIAKIILYDFHGTSAIVRGILFLVLGTVGFFTIWKVEKK